MCLPNDESRCAGMYSNRHGSDIDACQLAVALALRSTAAYGQEGDKGEVLVKVQQCGCETAQLDAWLEVTTVTGMERRVMMRR